MRHQLATILLGPLLMRQGAAVRKRITVLPEPAGAREGRTGAGPRLRLLVLGDSAGAGVGALSQQEALTGRAVATLATDYDVEWRLVARSGATLGRAQRMLARLPAARWDWIVISLGVNDVVAGTTPWEWREGLSRLREELRQRFGSPRQLYSGLPPVHLFPALPQPLRWYLGARTREFDRALADWCDEYEDCARLATDFSRDPNLMAADGFHPGPELYRRWGHAVAEHIKAARRAD